MTRPRWVSSATGLAVVYAVYLAAMAPGLFWRDSMEYCFIGHQLDISHPAGSPTFALLSKAFSFLPLGALPWRANLLSTTAALAAVALLWAATARWLRAAGLADGAAAWAWGAAAALTFAFSESFWAWSMTAEVYSLQAAALAGLLWLAAAAADGHLADARLSSTIGLLLGISCGAHMVQALYAPAFALALCLGPGAQLRWRGGLLMIGFFFVGFAVFAYLPARAMTDPPYNHGNPQTLDAFFNHITGRTYARIIHHFPWRRIWFDLSKLPGHFWRELNPLLALSAVVGAAAAARRAPRALALAALVVVGHLYLYIKDWWRAFGYIPLFMLGAWLGALGLARVAQRWRPSAGAPTAAIVALAAACGACGVATHWADSSRTTHDLAQRHGAGLLASMPLNALLVANEDHLANNVLYQQLIERQRPDVQFCHQVWLNFPDELGRRFPDWPLAGYDPAQPLAAQRLLLASDRGGGAFWDYDLMPIQYVDSSHLAPHGVVYRLLPAPWDGAGSAADYQLWRDVFRPIALSPVVAPRGYDFTVQEVYGFLFNRRTKIMVEAGRLDEAAYDAQMAVWLQPTWAEFANALALVRLAQQRPREAIAAAQRALALDPECGYCWASLGRARLQLNDRAGALRDYQTAGRWGLPEAADWLMLARLALEAGRAADAERAIVQGERRQPSPAQQAAFDLLGAALSVQRGDCRTAAERLARLPAGGADSVAAAEIRRQCQLPEPNQAQRN